MQREFDEAPLVAAQQRKRLLGARRFQTDEPPALGERDLFDKADAPVLRFEERRALGKICLVEGVLQRRAAVIDVFAHFLPLMQMSQRRERRAREYVCGDDARPAEADVALALPRGAARGEQVRQEHVRRAFL